MKARPAVHSCQVTPVAGVACAWPIAKPSEDDVDRDERDDQPAEHLGHGGVAEEGQHHLDDDGDHDEADLEAGRRVDARPWRRGRCRRPTMRMSPSASKPIIVSQLHSAMALEPLGPKGARLIVNGGRPGLAGPAGRRSPTSTHERLPTTMRTTASVEAEPERHQDRAVDQVLDVDARTGPQPRDRARRRPPLRRRDEVDAVLLDVEREVVVRQHVDARRSPLASSSSSTAARVWRTASRRGVRVTRPPIALRAWGPLERAAPLVAAHGLVKRFGDFTAVDGIDFEINAGRELRLPRARTAPARRRR